MRKKAPSNIEPIAVSITEAAKAIGISRSSLYELVQAGELQTFKIGKRRLVAVSTLHALAAGENVSVSA